MGVKTFNSYYYREQSYCETKLFSFRGVQKASCGWQYRAQQTFAEASWCTNGAMSFHRPACGMAGKMFL